MGGGKKNVEKAEKEDEVVENAENAKKREKKADRGPKNRKCIKMRKRDRDKVVEKSRKIRESR